MSDVDDIKAEILKGWPSGARKPDGAEFEAYCGTVARLRNAQARLEKDGEIISDPKGNAVPHPALLIEQRAAEQLRKWGRRFEPPRR